MHQQVVEDNQSCIVFSDRPDACNDCSVAAGDGGERGILHGCHIHDNCLIGMGSTVMDGAVIHAYAMLGAGSLVSPGKELEGGYLWLGSPARKVRELNDAERKWLDYSATHYVNLKNDYLTV